MSASLGRVAPLDLLRRELSCGRIHYLILPDPEALSAQGCLFETDRVLGHQGVVSHQSGYLDGDIVDHEGHPGR